MAEHARSVRDPVPPGEFGAHPMLVHVMGHCVYTRPRDQSVPHADAHPSLEGPPTSMTELSGASTMFPAGFRKATQLGFRCVLWSGPRPGTVPFLADAPLSLRGQ